MRFVIRRSANSKDWYWHILAKNNKIIADGAEGYSGLAKAHRAVSRINVLFIVSLPVEVDDRHG